MNSIFICAIKVLGFPFAVLTKEEAEIWTAEDPITHYYYEIDVKKL